MDLERILGFVIMGFGWPIFMAGSFWLLTKMKIMSILERKLLVYLLLAFLFLGLTCTAYWLGYHWYVGVVASISAFIILFSFTVVDVLEAQKRKATQDWET